MPMVGIVLLPGYFLQSIPFIHQLSHLGKVVVVPNISKSPHVTSMLPIHPIHNNYPSIGPSYEYSTPRLGKYTKLRPPNK